MWADPDAADVIARDPDGALLRSLRTAVLGNEDDLVFHDGGTIGHRDDPTSPPG